MNFKERPETVKGTIPLFPTKTNRLVDFCQGLSVTDIAQLLNISAKMAHDVYGYFHTFHLDDAPKRSAAFAFNGIAFQGLNIHDFTTDELFFAQSHLNIVSALYGLLRPLDLIKPYRLDVGTKLSTTDLNNLNSTNLSSTYPKSNYLYGFWQETVNQYLSTKLSKDDNTIINLSSSEYYKMIVPELLSNKIKMITISFREERAEGLKQVIVYAKKARGQMARFIVKNKLTKAEDIKAFDTDGYFYYPAQSTPTEWIFVR